MSGSISRQNAIQAVIDGTYVEPMNYIDNPVTEFYGCNVFTDEVMKARLPKNTYKLGFCPSKLVFRFFCCPHGTASGVSKTT